MIARIEAWWRSRQLRVLYQRTRDAAATYQAFKSRYETAISLEQVEVKDEPTE